MGSIVPKVGAFYEKCREISHDDVKKFGELVADFSPVHFELSAAQGRGFSAPIVHGFLIGSFFSEMLGSHLPGPHSVIGSVKLQFREPILVGQFVHFRVEVESTSASTGLAKLSLAASVEGRVHVTGSAICILRDHARTEV